MNVEGPKPSSTLPLPTLPSKKNQESLIKTGVIGVGIILATSAAIFGGPILYTFLSIFVALGVVGVTASIGNRILSPKKIQIDPRSLERKEGVDYSLIVDGTQELAKLRNESIYENQE